MPPDECPDVMGSRDPIHKHGLDQQTVPLHRRFTGFPAQPSRKRTYSVTDLHHDELVTRLERIERKLDDLLVITRPGMAAQRWELP